MPETFLKNFAQAHQWLLDLDKHKAPHYAPEKIQAFLKAAGDPQNKYKVVHVAGTSGKGSVCAMLASILEAAGYKTGLTISPYLFCAREKIQINGKHISESAFVKLVNQHQTAIIKYDLTYFEAFIALALVYFAAKKIDYAVVEVGMGGRLDATNVFKAPALAIVTSIGFDHMQVLGNTLAKIAKEKAGIIKNPKQAITGSKLIKNAELINTKNYELLVYNFKFSKFVYKKQIFKINLLGEFQVENAILAIEAARRLKLPLAAVKNGLQKVKHFGRFSVIKNKPLIIADGAHNVDKMQAFAKSLTRLVDFSRYQKKYLLTAIKFDKEYQKMLPLITPYFDEIIVTTFDKGLAPEVLAKAIKNKPVKIIENPQKAYQFIKKRLDNHDICVITGSLYLLGALCYN